MDLQGPTCVLGTWWLTELGKLARGQRTRVSLDTRDSIKLGYMLLDAAPWQEGAS